jgi:putative ABC transport system permease protein
VAASLGRFADARDNSESVQVEVLPGLERLGEPKPQGDAAATRRMLASLPGTAGVTAVTDVPVPVAGSTAPVRLQVFDGDHSALGYQDQLVQGRWLAGPGDIVVTSAFLRGRGAGLGDTVTLHRDGVRSGLTIVGEVMGDDPDEAFAEWAAVQRLAPGATFDGDLVRYLVRLAPATDVETYLAAVRQAGPGLMPVANDRGTNEFVVTVVSISVVLTVMLSIVAALGVFQTVVLNTHERRRDLGMLKSIGMTPRQVTAMMVTSMAMLGALGGLLGIAAGMVAHGISVPLVAAAAGTDIPATMMTVWRWPLLLPLLVAGLAIAVLGALLPARSAGRLPVAEALRSE